MQTATLCYPVEGDEVLLIEKRRGIGAGLINGPGGKIEPGETPRECARREVHEEVGLSVDSLTDAGAVEFYLDDEPVMFVHLFRTTEFSGTPRESPEARPRWFPVDDLPLDRMWEDDRLWLPDLLAGERVRGTFWFEDDDDGDARGPAALDDAEMVTHEIAIGVPPNYSIPTPGPRDSQPLNR